MPGISYEEKVKRNNFEKYFKIISFCNTDELSIITLFKQKEYHFDNNLSTIPLCKTCKINPCRFAYRDSKYYNNYCSEKCSKNSKETLEKRRATCLKKYGVDNVSKSKEVLDKITNTFETKYGKGVKRAANVKEFIDKQQNTMLERHGVKVFSQSEEIQKKIKENNLKKYGVTHPAKTKEHQQKILNTNLIKYSKKSYLATEKHRNKLKGILKSPEVLENRKKTNLQRFGVEWPSQLDFIKQKVKDTLIQRYGPEVTSTFTTPSGKVKSKQTMLERYGVKYGCLLQSNYKESKLEKKLREILNLSKKKIGNKEFDICDEEKKILIEVDGEYYHVDDLYHINFSQLFNFLNDFKKEYIAIENGYTLYRIKIGKVKELFESKETITLEKVLNNCYEKDYNPKYKLSDIITLEYLFYCFENYDKNSVLKKLYTLLEYNALFIAELVKDPQDLLSKIYGIHEI